MVFLLDSLEVGALGLVDFGEEDHNESDDEDAHGDEERGCCVGNCSLSSLTDERTHEDVDSNGSSAVEHATDLDELVALVSASAEDVKHGVYNSVKHAHAETADECSHEIYAESSSCGHAFPSAHPLYENADDADNERNERCAFVTYFLKQHTGGDTHHEVCDEVAVVADL